MTAPVRASERGFTLVEMLVSLALLGVAAALLAAGVGMAGIITTRQRIADGDVGAVAAAQMLLRERIERLRAVTSEQSADAIVDAHGSAVSFDFIGDPPDNAGPDALRHYRLARTATGDVILYTLDGLDARVDPRDPGVGGWTPLPVVAGASSLTIGYYGTTLAGGAPAWQSLWADRRQPPQLVRIAIAFPPGDRRRWPDLVVAPRATVNAACRLDALTGRCAATT